MNFFVVGSYWYISSSASVLVIIVVCPVYFRLYLGCFGWVINLIYSTLFSNILHAFRHNIAYAQNLGLSNRYALFTCSDLTSAIILSREDA